MPRVSALSLLFVSTLAFAAKTDGNNKKVVKDFTQAKAKLVQSDMLQRKVMGAVYRINEKMKAVSFKRSRLADEMAYLNSKVSRLAKKSVKLEGQVEAEQGRLSKRLRAMYMLGGQGVVRVLFSAQSSHDFDRNLRFMKKVADRDYSVIRNYMKKVTKLENSKGKLRKKVKKLLIVKKDIGKQEKNLESQQKVKQKLLSKVRSERERQLSLINKIGKKAERTDLVDVNPELAELLSATFFAKKGHLPKPVDGALLNGFGVVEDPEYGYRLSHKGHVYLAKASETVRAIHGGKVAFAGKLPGYGQVVIVDHGDHYFSVYGALENIIVDKGEKVKPGEMLARLSSQGVIAGRSKLYFEIRHFSDSVDPNKWLSQSI